MLDSRGATAVLSASGLALIQVRWVMSTRGDVTVIVDDHFYSHYQHNDMYHSGHMSALLSEAADISRSGEWDEVIEGWTGKAWLDYDDDELPKSLRDTVRHPDGDECQRSDWSYAMRPRLSYQQMVDAEYEETAKEVFKTGVGYSAPIWGEPSWRAAGQMLAMLKSDFADPGLDYGVVVDIDNQEIVCLAYRTSENYETAHVPIAVAPLADADAVQALADWAKDMKMGMPVSQLDPPPPVDVLEKPDSRWVYVADERFEFHPSVGGPPITSLNPYETYQQRADKALADAPDIMTMQVRSPTHTFRNWVEAAPSLQDGQWLRPEGFPPLEGTPRSFPAKRRPDFGVAASLGSSAGGAGGLPRCGHIGKRSGQPCVRSQHKDRHHRYQ